MKWFYLSCFFVLQSFVKGVVFKWSPEYKPQAEKTTCLLGNHQKNISFYHETTNKRNTAFTHLGKVQDIEVCGLLCCEVESCDLALLEKNSHCYAVKCNDFTSCDFSLSSPIGNSEIVMFRRKSGSDVWTSGEATNKSGTNDQENKAKIVTKQTAVQKSAIPEIMTITNSQKNEAVITLSNNSDSPMDALLQKETTMIHEKQQQQNKEANSNESAKKEHISDKILDVTEHYLKAEEKSDMTALQENETSSVHPKISHHRKDLRHTLISPITIGAFTCMAVIAVSGFAMAIIKYQRERKEFEDKQTQKP